jgi:hypothetical protein
LSSLKYLRKLERKALNLDEKQVNVSKIENEQRGDILTELSTLAVDRIDRIFTQTYPL